MSAQPAPRLTRRSFLKLGATALAVTVGLGLPLPALPAPGAVRLRTRSALPRPGYEFLPFSKRHLDRLVAPSGVVLVPAYVAAQLIQAGRLQTILGPAGRPHDPDGRYTVPFAYRVAAVRFLDALAAPQTVGWADLWSAAEQAVWPAHDRLIIGAALLRRGYSPNDAHPGHLAQAAADLEQLHTRLAPAGTSRFQAWPRADASVALELADPAEVGSVAGLRLPAEGTMLIEYDWVVPAGPAPAVAARQFIDAQRLAAPLPRMDLPVRLIPLMPLPPAARAQAAAIWASLAVRPVDPSA